MNKLAGGLWLVLRALVRSSLVRLLVAHELPSVAGFAKLQVVKAHNAEHR